MRGTWSLTNQLEYVKQVYFVLLKFLEMHEIPLLLLNFLNYEIMVHIYNQLKYWLLNPRLSFCRSWDETQLT